MTDPVAYGDLSQLAGNLAAASGASFESSAAALIRQAAEQVASDAKQRAPRKTGALADSIAVVFSGSLTAMIGPTKKYGVFQEFGTGSRREGGGSYYWIYPKRASMLRFEVGGKTVFAKKVHHPGVAPQPFMRPAAENALSDLQNSLGQQAVNLIVMGGGS